MSNNVDKKQELVYNDSE